MYVYIYHILYIYKKFVPFNLEMSQNINSTTGHLVIFRFLQIFYGLLYIYLFIFVYLRRGS